MECADLPSTPWSLLPLYRWAFRQIDERLIGQYTSSLKGIGADWGGVREYEPGDDPRHINWHMTARSSHPWINHGKDERLVTLILVVDCSASICLNPPINQGMQQIVEICALVALLAVTQHDRIGLLLFTEEEELYIKPYTGMRHLFHLLNRFLGYSPRHKGTSLVNALKTLSSVAPRHSVCLLLSDFLTPFHSLSPLLTSLSYRVQLVSIHITSLIGELLLQPPALWTWRDPETNTFHLVDLHRPATREQVRQIAASHHISLHTLMSQHGIPHLVVHPNEMSTLIVSRLLQCMRKRCVPF